MYKQFKFDETSIEKSKNQKRLQDTDRYQQD